MSRGLNSSCIRSALARSKVCGCFYCLSQFSFQQVTAWIDDGQTALCPVCGVDAVLGFALDNADLPLLRKMHDERFEKSGLTADEWKGAVEKNAWPSREK